MDAAMVNAITWPFTFTGKGADPVDPSASRTSSSPAQFGEHQAHGRRDRDQQDALGEQLADQPASTRADGQPDRHLALPRGRTRQQQV